MWARIKNLLVVKLKLIKMVGSESPFDEEGLSALNYSPSLIDGSHLMSNSQFCPGFILDRLKENQ